MEKTSKRVVIVGIPGVGKTTVVTKLEEMLKAAEVKTDYVVFGTVMFEEAQKIGVKHRDDMRKLPVKAQRKLQEKAATSITKKKADVVLVDTHLFINTKEGYYPGLPHNILTALSPTNLVLVQAEALEILARRQKDNTRNRDMVSLEAIERDLMVARSMLSASAVLSGAAMQIVNNAEGKADQAAKAIFDAIH
jgi:adenylate kinase